MLVIDTSILIAYLKKEKGWEGIEELISKPWVGSILDLGEPDPGGRRWSFGS